MLNRFSVALISVLLSLTTFALTGLAQDRPDDPSYVAACLGGVTVKGPCHKYLNVQSFLSNQIIGPGWICRDFGAAGLNPNLSSVEVRYKFIASNGNFRYYNNDVGTTYLLRPALPPWSDTQRLIANGINTPNQIFPPVDNVNNDPWDWTGTVKVFSMGGESIYSHDVFKLTSGDGAGSTKTAAFLDAWAQLDKTADAFWDGDRQRFFGTFANFFKNLTSHPKGWQTTVTVTNNSPAGSLFMIFRNHMWSGEHNHSTPGCGTLNEGVLSLRDFVGISAIYGDKIIDPFRDLGGATGHPLPADTRELVHWEHDTALSLEIEGYQSGWENGITVKVRVYPNTSNNCACVKEGWPCPNP